MKRFLLLLVLISACSQQDIISDWSDGNCIDNCQAIEYGCGGGHIVCTSNPEKYKDLTSTCDIITDHPSQKGYNCECINQKCAWRK